MGPSLDKLIQEINEKEEHKVTCLIVDLSMHFLLDVANRYDIPRAALHPLIPHQFLEYGDLDQKRSWLSATQKPFIFNATQLEELALGLEATQKPFLWVVRNDLMDGKTVALPSEFTERIKDRGCLVSWASQLLVLSHPS
eukprot:Gb_05346 [translate_table: standard]